MKLKGKTQLNSPIRTATVKLIVCAVSLVLLLSSLIYMTWAWYTKMVSVAGMKFEVAKWDFTANYAMDDFYVNVDTYSAITGQHAAPGTTGWVPLKLGAGQSDTDVSYEISIDRSTMSEDFRQRIFFYYFEKDENTNTDLKTYIGDSPKSTDRKIDKIEGTIAKGDNGQSVTIYWEWIYQYPHSDETDAANLESAEAWDDFDTKVGKNPELYKGDMMAKISIVGVQVEVEANEKPGGN